MKIVINDCFGGFRLSEKAYKFLGLHWDGTGFLYSRDHDRTDKKLVECVEQLGNDASGSGAYLVVIEIPDNIDYVLDDYRGIETVIEKGHYWNARSRSGSEKRQ